jgi:hypothetical protein
MGAALAAGNAATRAGSSAPTPVAAVSSEDAASPASGGVTGAQQRRLSGNPAGGQNPSGQGGGNAAASANEPPGRAVVGTVSRVENNQLVVTTPQGQATVTLSEQTTIQRAVPATVADLKPGERVLVTARPGSDGSLTALGVQIIGLADGSETRAPSQR